MSTPTTGSNSNTSGANVLNLGYLPSAIFKRVVDLLTGILGDAKKVLSGQATLGVVDFSAKAGSDAVSDAVMEEIARRLIVTIETKTDGNVVFSSQPPEDKSKVWWQTDPTTGIPIGSPKTWNGSAWVEITNPAVTAPVAKKRTGSLYFPAGAGSQNFNFDDIETVDYEVNVTPTTFLNGVWQPAPGTFPTHFGWTIINKTNTQVTIAIYGAPTGGLNFEIDITERLAPTA